MSGDLQGTVLGPLLFSLHIDDIMSDIESEIRLFADDCNYAPNFEKVGDILVSACPYVCTYVCMYEGVSKSSCTNAISF